MKKILNGVCMILCILAVCSLMTEPVLASETRASEEENDVYDALQESIRENWDEGFKRLEAQDEIEIKGPLPERILRSIANVFYRHLVSIKAWSLFIGIISLIVGIFIAATAKLNKKLRRFAISLFVIALPTLLIIFVFGITKLVSMFI
jgi:hypothetical protein